MLSPARTVGLVLAFLATAAHGPSTFAATAPTAPTAPMQLADTIAQRVQPCFQCHGKEGRATSQGYFPRIAGKPAGYLYHQLLNFREGRRRNETMAHLVEHLSDAYLEEIAGYFASLDLPTRRRRQRPRATPSPTARP